MKKSILMAWALLGLCMHAATAAPMGWYSLDETWRDGSFSGRFHYDASAPTPITRITGVLSDTAQTTAIDTVWAGETPPGETWIFVNNAQPGDPDTYDAGFYLNLLDLGTSLSLDLAADNGLYDWSRDFAFFEPGQLNGSPLLSFRIAEVVEVPEPGSLALIGAGLLATVPWRRRSPQRVGKACAKRRSL